MRSTRTRKKSDRPPDPADPPRRRANTQRGHGTFANDRPPICSVVSRDTSEIRYVVTDQATKETCRAIVATSVPAEGTIFYTDEGRAITTCIPCIGGCATAITSGHGTMMAMDDARCIAIPATAGAQHCAGSCGPCAGCIKPISPATSPCSKPSPGPNGSRLTWCAGCAMERLFARRLDMSQKALMKKRYNLSLCGL